MSESIHEYFCWNCQQVFYMHLHDFQYSGKDSFSYVSCPYCLQNTNSEIMGDVEIDKRRKKNGKKTGK